MLQIVRKILYTGISRYPGNTIFGTILDSIEDIGGIPTKVELFLKLSEANPTPTTHTELPISKSIIDHRIRHLVVSSFKGFTGEKLYGINCCENSDSIVPNKVSSAVFLGSNGVGKTSLYCAMEMGAMNHSYIADVHGYDTPAKQLEYIRNESQESKQPQASDELEENHEAKKRNEPKVLISYNNGEILSYPENKVELCPRAFFCSQFDMQYYESHGMSIDYIMEQLGRSKLYQLLNVLTNLHKVLLKANNAAVLGKRLRACTDLVERDRLTSQISSDLNNIKDLLGSRRISRAKYEWVTDDKLKDFKEVLGLVREDVELAMDNFRKISKNLFPKLMDYYLKEDRAEILVLEEGDTVVHKIRLAGRSEAIEPRKWFNTFRMKLFILTVKLVLAFTSKIIDKVNFPVVMDDVLDSSDFRNKYEIKRYFNSIVLGHDEYDDLIQMPLQILFFTQDKIIASNVYEGMADGTQYIGVKHCRLYNYKEAETEDTEMEKSMVEIDADNKYYNLAGLIERSR